MSWLDAQHLRIFVPADLYNTPPNISPEDLCHIHYVERMWVVQVLGAIVRPILLTYLDHINWIWIGQYDGEFAEFAVSHQLPARYNSNGKCFYVDFRLSIKKAAKDEARQLALSLTTQTEFFASRWDHYDVIHDLVDPNGNSKNRFIRPDANDEQRLSRAHMIVNFMDATARLWIDALVEIDGYWSLEPNEDTGNNPDGSLLQSILHLFHNSTQTPLRLYFSYKQSETDTTVGEKDESNKSIEITLCTTYMNDVRMKLPRDTRSVTYLKI